jgi:site-specific DNA-methyltransferase (adenine-specific)
MEEFKVDYIDGYPDGEPKSAAHAGWIDRGRMRGDEGEEGWQRPWMQDEGAVSNAARRYLPGSTEAQAFAGWGTALKPAFEPVVVARKPLAGTLAANVLAWGTGALNVDGCRIEGGERPLIISKSEDSTGILGNGLNGSSHGGSTTAGRWPANVVLDETQAEALDEMSGEAGGGTGRSTRGGGSTGDWNPTDRDASPGQTIRGDGRTIGFGDSGGASRFFYVAKADASERPRVNGTAHPTVKPLDLMRWLVRLVTPPGGTVLEPFAGSGTTVEACIIEGFQCIAIEREADYLPLIRQRIDRRRDPVEALRGQAADLGLFDLLGGEGA